MAPGHGGGEFEDVMLVLVDLDLGLWDGNGGACYGYVAGYAAVDAVGVETSVAAVVDVHVHVPCPVEEGGC